ncbi:MAG: DevR family CRISPR-associated autoregulator [Acidilobaceae archaeon]
MSSGGVLTLSLSGRFLVNVEALNMVESVGNVTKHRRAPIVTYSEGKYNVVYVPVVSGEAIAYHYQRLLTQIAESMGLKVTDLDKQGYYLKYSDDDIIKNWYPEIDKKVIDSKNPCDIEKAFIEASVVADVGGFLYMKKGEGDKKRSKESESKADKDETPPLSESKADKDETPPLIKRTSRIRFSYLVPSLDAVASGAAVLYPQLHVRYAPLPLQRVQALYYVESGSALYTLSSILVASDIAKLEYCAEEKSSKEKSSRPEKKLQSSPPSEQNEPQKSLPPEEKIKRVKAALRALVALIDGLSFGAKRSRYLPIYETKSLIISVFKGPIEFTVSPATDKSYIEKTLKRVEILKELCSQIKEELCTAKMFIYSNEGIKIPEVKGVEVNTYESSTEALWEAAHYVIALLNKQSQETSEATPKK